MSNKTIEQLGVNKYFLSANEDVTEFKDIYFETSIGVLKHNVTRIDFDDCNSLGKMCRVEEIDRLRKKYGKLYINEARKTYDNNMYLLISEKFILAIEYILNSSFTNSIQELRVIEDIQGNNMTEFDDFKELDVIELPSLPA